MCKNGSFFSFLSGWNAWGVCYKVKEMKAPFAKPLNLAVSPTGKTIRIKRMPSLLFELEGNWWRRFAAATFLEFSKLETRNWSNLGVWCCLIYFEKLSQVVCGPSVCLEENKLSKTFREHQQIQKRLKLNAGKGMPPPAMIWGLFVKTRRWSSISEKKSF